MNKYKKWYNQIIANGLTKKPIGYERHHILPRSLGGTNDRSNLIYITARQHFICHWLLTKIYKDGEDHWKMLNALRMMRAENKNQQRYTTKITSRVYAKLKEEYAKLQSERVTGKNNPMYDDKFYRSERGYKSHREAVLGDKNGAKKLESRKKISESKLGKQRDTFSEEWKTKMSLAKQGEKNNMYGKTHSSETIEKIREKAKLRKYSDETNEKRRLANLGLKREKKLCPYCKKSVAVNGYKRWHGDNCKNKP